MMTWEYNLLMLTCLFNYMVLCDFYFVKIGCQYNCVFFPINLDKCEHGVDIFFKSYSNWTREVKGL